MVLPTQTSRGGTVHLTKTNILHKKVWLHPPVTNLMCVASQIDFSFTTLTLKEIFYGNSQQTYFILCEMIDIMGIP